MADASGATGGDEAGLAIENARLKDEVARLRAALLRAEAAASGHTANTQPIQDQGPPWRSPDHSLTKDQVERYSRHLLLPSVGLAAQERLCHGRVLIVGCGGLGCPAAIYLAAAGVGVIGLVDHDVVDTSNLHRQVAHTEARVGMHKAVSAALTLSALNGGVRVVPHMDGLTAGNACALVQQYDVVLDASDNPPTRYLINDACVACHKPLVSAAAVGTDGQLTVYHHGSDGPCYRCMFPESPAAENCSRCADAGVLGPVPGVMGVLQAIEAIKVLGGIGEVLSRRMLLYDALAGRFSTVKLRARRDDCVACGSHPCLTQAAVAAYDYTAFTGQQASDGPPPPANLIPEHLRVTPQQLQAAFARRSGTSLSGAPQHRTAHAVAALPQKGPASTAPELGAPARPMDPAPGGGHAGAVASRPAAAPLVLDVRPATQFALLHLPGAVNIPFAQLPTRLAEAKALAAAAAATAAAAGEEPGGRTEGVGGFSRDSAQSSGSQLPDPLSGPADGTRAPGEASHRAPSAATQLTVHAPQASSSNSGGGIGGVAADDVVGAGVQSVVGRLVVVCRRGNDSQRAAVLLQQHGVPNVVDMVGGMQLWAQSVGLGMPVI